MIQIIDSNGKINGIGAIQFMDSNGNIKYISSGGSTGNAIQSISAGTGQITSGQAVFSNANGVSFGVNGQTVTASIMAGAAAGSISAGTTSVALGQVIFSNSNGVVFGLDGSTLTASYTTPTITNSSWTASADTRSETISQLVFSNSNGVSFGLTGGTITATVKTDYITTTQTNYVFSNSNGISFGTNASTVTASYTVPNVTNSSWTISDANTSQTIAQLNFTNSNGLTLSLSTSNNGHATVVGSYTVPVIPSATSWTVSDSLTSATVGRLAFTASNGLTLTLSTSNNGNHTVIGSYTVPTVTNSSWTVSDAATSQSIGLLAFTNSNGLTLSLSTSNNGHATVIGSYTVPSTAGLLSNIKVSAGTLSANRSDLTFADSNGISFGLNTNGVITGTVQTNYLTTAMASDAGSRFVNTSAGLNLTNISATFNSNSISLSVGNYLTTAMASDAGSRFVNTSAGLNLTNVSATFNSNSISLSVAAQGLTSQSNQAISAANGSFTFQTATFANSNGVSFSTGTQGIYATVATNYLTTAMASDAGSRFVNTSAGLNLTNISATFNSNSISLSVNAGGATNLSVTAGNGSSLGSLSQLYFSNANNFSFGLSTSNNGSATLTASYTVPTQSNQTVGLYMSSNTTSSVSFGTIDARSFTLVGKGVLSVGYSNGSVVLSAPSAAPSPVNISAGTTSNNLGSIVFSNSNGVSFGLNGSTITASAVGGGVNIANSQTTYTSGIANLIEGGGAITIASTTGQSYLFSVPQTSSISGTGQVSISVNASTISIGVPNALTLSYFNPQDAYVQVAGQIGQSSLFVQPMQAPNVQFDRIVVPIIYSNASNSSNSQTISLYVGIYTKNVSTLSSISSVLYTTNMSASGRVGTNYQNFGGVRLITIGLTGTLTEGQYWVGMLSRTTSNAGGATLSNVLASQMNSSFSGLFGAASNKSIQYTRGLGVLSVQTAAMPNTIAFSDLYGNSSAVLRQPLFYFVSGTV